jgi:hypothetical protein
MPPQIPGPGGGGGPPKRGPKVDLYSNDTVSSVVDSGDLFSSFTQKSSKKNSTQDAPSDSGSGRGLRRGGDPKSGQNDVLYSNDTVSSVVDSETFLGLLILDSCFSVFLDDAPSDSG